MIEQLPLEILFEISQYLGLVDYVRLRATSTAFRDMDIPYEARYRRDIAMQIKMAIYSGNLSYFLPLSIAATVAHLKSALRCGQLEMALCILDSPSVPSRANAHTGDIPKRIKPHLATLHELKRDENAAGALALLLHSYGLVKWTLTPQLTEAFIASPLGQLSAFLEGLACKHSEFCWHLQYTIVNASPMLLRLLLDPRLSSLAVINLFDVCQAEVPFSKSSAHSKLFTRIPLSRYDISHHGQRLYLIICSYGYLPFYFQLLARPEFSAIISNDLQHEGFNLACKNGHIEIVRHFLDQKLVDPAFGESQSLITALWNGHQDIVACLLEDGRVSLSDKNHLGLARACGFARYQLVQFLLQNQSYRESLPFEVLRSCFDTLLLRTTCNWVDSVHHLPPSVTSAGFYEQGAKLLYLLFQLMVTLHSCRPGRLETLIYIYFKIGSGRLADIFMSSSEFRNQLDNNKLQDLVLSRLDFTSIMQFHQKYPIGVIHKLTNARRLIALASTESQQTQAAAVFRQLDFSNCNYTHSIIDMAFKQQKRDIVLAILSHPQANPNHARSKWIRYASDGRFFGLDPQILLDLLTDERVDVFRHGFLLELLTRRHNYTELQHKVRLVVCGGSESTLALLQPDTLYGTVSATTQRLLEAPHRREHWVVALRNAAQYRSLSHVQQILQHCPHSDLDRHGESLWQAMVGPGHIHTPSIDIVRVLLQDGRINPTAKDSRNVQHAITIMHLPLLRCLLEDDRVRLACSTKDLQSAFTAACRSDHAKFKAFVSLVLSQHLFPQLAGSPAWLEELQRPTIGML
ncbi:hypothetical protein HDU91_002495 [Kappamyces sp. JEL0680]|nr:hypothetical protein HDU91_002495 [Kappamyces sp. JEL0680]